MATFQSDIFLTVLKAKDTAGQWAVCFIDKEAHGEDLGCCELKLTYLVKLIRAMETFYCSYFPNDRGVLACPTCLTLAQGQDMLAKLKATIK